MIPFRTNSNVFLEPLKQQLVISTAKHVLKVLLQAMELPFALDAPQGHIALHPPSPLFYALMECGRLPILFTALLVLMDLFVN